MRKLLCLMILLFGLILPCAAEEAPAAPEEAVGEWKVVLSITGAQMHARTDEDAPRLLITEDGWLTTPEEGAPRFPLTCDATARKWYISNPETGEKFKLLKAEYDDQLFIGLDANHMICCVRTDGSPVWLSPAMTTPLAYAGDWAVRSLYLWAETDTGEFSACIDFSHDLFEDRYIAPLTISLPPFPSFETIQQVWKDALSQTADDCPLRALQEIYGYELHGAGYTDNLLLVTRYGLLMLQRKSAPELDPAFQEKLDGLAGWWYPDEISVGGIYLPASAMDIPDDPITIDEQGNVLLPDGSVTALRLEEDTLLLGEYSVSGGFSLTLAEDVELDFISEQDWYRKQLCGDWQLSHIAVPSLDMDRPIDPAVTDVTLNIVHYDDWCHMDSDKYRISSYSYQAPNEFFLIPLYGDDRFTLTITGPDNVQVKPESGSYTLLFTRIENTEE